MASFSGTIPTVLAESFVRRQAVLVRLDGDTLHIDAGTSSATASLADITRVQAQHFRRNTQYSIGNTVHYELRLWRRDQAKPFPLKPNADSLQDYAHFMRAFVPAVREASPGAVFEAGPAPGMRALWGVIMLLLWLSIMMFLGTKLLNRVMTSSLKTALWGITLAGCVAILVFVIRWVRRPPRGPDAILQDELPPG